MPRLSTALPAYRQALADGSFRQTYQALVSLVQELRTDLHKELAPDWRVAKLLHGYVDYTYFYLQDDFLQARRLKLAVVLDHAQTHFELWLLGQTKAVQRDWWTRLQGLAHVDPHQMPTYAIFARPLLDEADQADFDDPAGLCAAVHQAFIQHNSALRPHLVARS